MEVKGTVDQLNCSHLEIVSEEQQFRLRGMSRYRIYHIRRMRMCMVLFSELSANTRG